jgi:two-component system, OmpR family, response regulator RegX3
MRSVIVHPDPMRAKLLRFVLCEAGHEVVLAETSQEGLTAAVGQETGAVLLELDLPDGDGCGLCTELRGCRYRGPIMVITKRYATADRLQAFAAGADDVIVDPFDPAELVARVEAMSRRYQRTDYQALGTILKAGDAELVISELTFRVVGRESVLLTPTELRLLECLMRNQGIVMRRETLTERTWGYDAFEESNRLEVYIRRLRKKIEWNPEQPEYIHTMRGIGYVFRASERDGRLPAGAA